MPISLGSTQLFWLYVLLFAASALACLWSLRAVSRVQHPAVRRGLSWFLLLCGGWAAMHVGYLVSPTDALRYAFYVGGLVVGWAAIGPWLYFCSAYTGRTLHKRSTVRLAAVATFLIVATVKVTNPIHGYYFSTAVATRPFRYLQIVPGVLHWVAMGLAYALAFIGFFMLYELFARVDSNTRPLFVLVGLTGIPIVLDVLSVYHELVLTVTYSPIGVAAFAVGVGYVYFDEFQVIRLTGGTDDPVIVVDDDDRIRECNTQAAAVFPTLSEHLGEPLAAALPDLAAALETDGEKLAITDRGSPRYYTVSTASFYAAAARLGTSITLVDVTAEERYRRELEDRNERLDRFASIVSHDLRNPLQVIAGRLDLAAETGDLSHLEPALRSVDRMHELIDDLLELSREGLSIDETEPVSVPEFARECWTQIPAEGATIVVEPFELIVDADPERLKQVFENLFRNAIEHGHENTLTNGDEDGGEDVTIRVGPLPDARGFYVADDGEGIDPGVRETLFDPGITTTADGTGFGLPIVRTVVEAHGWSITATNGADGGARFEIETGERDAEPVTGE
ncbi:Signal transduction histidine kinase [Halopenitus malekzadehii]|uniref:histidine kinase n=1 Tax=Halopenitus malekzadehii TaxID=1267564 RepID=A0A1H6J746_9EURY|nr:ATP-binding protein [Halopenitus malekzadehii]SEH57979.1 Signal transduction histidine kinase [Halopenitus malekzadehii]